MINPGLINKLHKVANIRGPSVMGETVSSGTPSFNSSVEVKLSNERDSSLDWSRKLAFRPGYPEVP